MTVERIAECRIAIAQARLLTLNAAHRMDTRGNKVAKAEIAMIKVAVPAVARVLRLADGPDEVQRQRLGRMELKKYR